MYKFLSSILAFCLLVLGIFYAVEKYNHSKSRKELTNEIARLEGTVKETETAYSARAIEVEKLKSQNKELNKIIKHRNEEVAALGEVVLQWKNKYFNIKNATETVVAPDGTTPIEIPTDCKECLANVRVKVYFDETQDYLRVRGHTVTNPPEASIDVSWERTLKLHFVLAKKDDKFRLYFDSDTPDLVASELSLRVDRSVFEKKWYEKVALGTQILVGPSVQSGLSVNYDILENWTFGPSFLYGYDGNKFQKFYGVNVLWYPFR